MARLTREEIAEITEGLAAKLGGGNGGTATPEPAAPSGWGAPAQQLRAPETMPAPEAVLVPMKYNLPNGGNVKIQLQFPGSVAGDPAVLAAFIESVVQIPGVDVWYPNRDGGRGGFGGYGGRGGYGGGGSGWRGNGGGGRW